jgi:hypothetical protein
MGLVFGLVVMLQVGHFAEHVAQWWQRDVQHLSTPPHGLLGVWLDVEWAHFIYNASLGVGLLMLFLGYGMHRREWRAFSPLGWWAMAGALVLQVAWHVPEHAVKMYQWVAHGWVVAPGILGRTPAAGSGPFDLLLLHFTYNAIVTGLMIVSYLAFRAYRRPVVGPVPAVAAEAAA